MITMEFDDIQKIWDEQNNKTMYAINEEALHKRIKSNKKKASFASNLNEIGLVAIAVITSGYLFLKHADDWNIYAIFPGVAILLTALYVIMARFNRKQREKQFDQTMLGDLDQAIANVEFEIKRAKTFLWWYMIPVAIPVFLNMYMKESSLLKWALVIGLFILSYVVVQFGLNIGQLPKKRALQKLRNKLTEE